MKLPGGSAQVKGAVYDPNFLIPDNTLVDVVVDRCDIRMVPDHIRELYRMCQTHSVNLRFMVTRGEFVGRILYLTLYPVVSPDGTAFPGSKFYSWLQALLGKDRVDNGYIFDTDDVIAQTLTLRVKQFPRSNGGVKNVVDLASPNESLDVVLNNFRTAVSDLL